uniref:PAK4-inhibitor INKA2 n=1 Tax=Nothoprocta perdicaria TaxID=30464 RepID=A0A8C7ECN8_NOTPE
PRQLCKPTGLSMKEVGDGLHEQMNCMMGALQELKLLQVQAALEQLQISGGRGAEQRVAPARPDSGRRRGGSSSSSSSSRGSRDEDACPAHGPSSGSGRAERLRAGTPEPGGNAWDGAAGTPGHGQRQGGEDGHDWTSSLLCQSRTRQPLVLGDNVFADLVGNWLDLPELEKKGERSEAPLAVSRSQELCRKFSLTANIFKKFLRSVRPDRDRLLKEKPCWLPPEDKEPEISKRPRKPSKLKGTFYLPLHGNTVPESIEYPACGFDINTAVWV